MKNNTHGFVLVILLIVLLIVAILFVTQFKSFNASKQKDEYQTYEDIAKDVVSKMNNVDYNAYSYLDE